MALVLKQALADALTHATIRITAILLDMNCIGDDGAKARACQTLRTANATTWLQTGTLLLELCNQALAAASAHNTTITMISLGYNRIGAAGIQAWVFQMFRSCRAALSWTSCQALADALRQNSAITHIDLRGNSIGDSGAKARVFQTCRLYSGIFMYILSGPCGSPEAELHRHVHQPP